MEIMVDEVGFEGALAVCLSLALEIFETLEAEKVRKRLADKKRVTLVSATEAGQLVGFKLGYEVSEDLYCSCLWGVRPTHRGAGVATRLMQCQHAWIADQGYQTVETRTSNLWKPRFLKLTVSVET
jgi:predicted GNAT superfamily acetyltransferase